jgi:hypothetical protein
MVALQVRTREVLLLWWLERLLKMSLWEKSPLGWGMMVGKRMGQQNADA